MKFIIVEGAHGVGKSTFVSKLKDQLPNCGILKLTGMPGSTETAHIKTKIYHNAVLNYMLSVKELPGYMILDRCFISEYVMATLYKNWNFREETDFYLRSILISSMDVTYIFLRCEREHYIERLKRDKVAYCDIAYDANKSIKQQDLYLDLHKHSSYMPKSLCITNDKPIDEVISYTLKMLKLLDKNY